MSEGGISMFTRSAIRKFLSAAVSLLMFSASPAAEGYSTDPTILKGDINSDGDVNSVDLSVMSLYLSGRASISREGFLSADMDNDGSVDSIDLVKLRKLIISKDTKTSDTETKPGIESPLSSPIDRTKYSFSSPINRFVDSSYVLTDNEFIKAPLSDMYGSLTSQGSGRVCIFYVDFPGCPYEYEPSLDEIRNAAFADESPSLSSFPHESINAFYKRASKHRVNISGDVYRYTTLHHKGYYEENPSRAEFIDEVLTNMDEYVDFNSFDANGDKTIDAIIISVPETAGEDHWWPCAGRYAGNFNNTIDGLAPGHIIVGNAEIKSADDSQNFVSSYIHELGHCMGLPDYYLYDQRSSEGLHGSAGFDTMDELFCDFSCASKLMLGWYRSNQIQVYDYNGDDEQTFILTDAQTENGSCVIIPCGNAIADDLCSEFIVLEYTTLNNNNKSIPEKYWWLRFGNGIRAFHVEAETTSQNGYKEFIYRSGNNPATDYNRGRRFIRVINDADIDNLYRCGNVLNSSVSGFRFYDSDGSETVDPHVEVHIGELVGDSYIITIRKEG